MYNAVRHCVCFIHADADADHLPITHDFAVTVGNGIPDGNCFSHNDRDEITEYNGVRVSQHVAIQQQDEICNAERVSIRHWIRGSHSHCNHNAQKYEDVVALSIEHVSTYNLHLFVGVTKRKPYRQQQCDDVHRRDRHRIRHRTADSNSVPSAIADTGINP